VQRRRHVEQLDSAANTRREPQGLMAAEKTANRDAVDAFYSFETERTDTSNLQRPQDPRVNVGTQSFRTRDGG